MAKKLNASLKSVHKAFQTKMDSLVKGNQSFNSFVEEIKENGQNSVFQRSRLENKTYDDKWVHELEVGFDAIDRIITHPRTFIKETQDLVLAGQAKRINSTSIRHLASHTRYIHGFNKEGQIVPERILSIGSDVDVQIYENRVLMSLIQRLTFFVEKRMRFISEKGETRNSDVLFIHSKTEIDGVRYEMDNRLKISVESDDKGDYEKNMKLLETIKNLNDRVNFYIKSPFMADMAGAKSVHSPIAMTNLLLKNPDYHKVAVLWKFIDSYTKLGISFDIEEKKGVFDEEYFNEIYGLTAASLATLHSNLVENRYLALKEAGEEEPNSVKKHFEPKVMLNLEDEVFLTHKFRYDQFPEHEDILFDPERDEEEKDFALTPEEVKKFKESDNEYLTEQLLTAKELREQAEEERNALDHEAMIKEMERRREEERRIQAEHEAEEAKRLAEEQKALAELEEKIRIDAEIRLERENELLRQARERIIKAAHEDAPIDNRLADKLHSEIRDHSNELVSTDFGYFSEAYTANENDELRRVRHELREKEARIARLEAALLKEGNALGVVNRGTQVVVGGNASGAPKKKGVKFMPKVLKVAPGTTVAPSKKLVLAKGNGQKPASNKPATNRAVVLPVATKPGSKKGTRFFKVKK